ncbi:DUF87 domain-containing protein [Haloplanus rallus]|uniref:DUF87 domain-containing protein n=1 Tax=Haloplanus rallus TaxID=1816183 RepID=A0A6B9F2J4_9EURY|nr:DUF87 domain-containing protein [Haloplanus rallus]QGX94566.1 DUF87 domain-containing protein [Haloplanus rallus]
MTETETITVADVSEGPGGDADADPGTPVSLPVVELLTGRGFVTGKSGSGKSNTASVLVENLLENNFPVLVVDTDGEYYGLKEEFELLHAGADDECDIQVSPEHAEKIASLALEGNVPIILDVSGYLDEGEAKELLLSVARHLFAKEKKLKKPFLMLIEEVHEYIPEGGGLDETGKMLIKIGKRGRKHGLGIVGISQRPADVKKDFITQCDWLVWHRLTWNNDTNVVSRIIDAEHANAVEDLGDGEAFLMTDWSESVRRVQFHRKRTFDAGATPGLDDFERPELKSISDDLVADLREISDEQERRESELADLRQELERKERRIEELEADLEEARDLSRMADQFAQAMLQKAEAPYRGGDGRNLARSRDLPPDQAELPAYEPDDSSDDGTEEATDGDREASDTADAEGGAYPTIEPTDWPTPGLVPEVEGVDEGATADDGSEGDADRGDATAGASAAAQADVTIGAAGDADATTDTGEGSGTVDATDAAEGAVRADAGADAAASGPEPGTREAVVATLRRRIEDLPSLSREMLAHYREAGQADPVDAHVAAGGTPKQTLAYGRNRPLRRAGLIEHVEQDTYRYALPDRVAERFDGHLDGAALASVQRAVEESFVDEAGLGGKTVEPREADADGDGRPEHDVPDEERTDVEMLPDDETVEPDDGFVTEDVAIIDDADDGGNGPSDDADDGGNGPSDDADDDGNGPSGDADDGGDTGATSAAEEDTGGVEIL